MDFGDAVKAIKAGNKLQRAGWNGQGMHVYLVSNLATVANISFTSLPSVVTFEPVIVMHTADGKEQPGWLASQADMLADDWSIVTP